VLEVGCGDGRLTWRYAQETASVLALDPAEEMIRRATEAAPETMGAKVEFLAADITNVELAPDAYDVAILAHSL
jgi:ubiquinone/menaquinone biosynthesis C-methylase UbiE